MAREIERTERLEQQRKEKETKHQQQIEVNFIQTFTALGTNNHKNFH